MVFGRSKVTPEADNAPEADDAQRQQLLAASATPSDDRYDLVLVHSKTDETDELTRRRQLIATRARLVGISVVREESSDGQEVLLKLSAPDAVLAEAAERTSMEKRLKTGEGYKDFTRAAMGDFSPASDASFFTSSERIHLLLALLELGLAEGGCDLDMNQEVEAGVLSQVVPMHERGVASGALMSGWCRKPLAFLPDQPLDEVKDYLGERVALYFAFMQHLVRSLVAPSIAGCLVLAWDGYSGSSDNILAPLYSFFMLCWVVAFAKSWRAEEARLAFRWNVADYEATERPRPQFKGPRERGFYSAEGYFVPMSTDEHQQCAPLVKRFTAAERSRRQCLSSMILVPITSAIIGAVVSVLAFDSSLKFAFAQVSSYDLGSLHFVFVSAEEKAAAGAGGEDAAIRLEQKVTVQAAQVLGGILLAIVIAITNGAYRLLAVRLNEWENHRTATAYEDALIVKTFTFQAINSYFSLVYIAFVKATETNLFPWLLHAEYCHDVAHFATRTAEQIRAEHGGLNPYRCLALQRLPPRYCLEELNGFLVGMVITQQVTGKLVEIGVPKLKLWLKEHARRRTQAAARAQAEAAGAAAAPPPSPSHYEMQTRLEPYDCEDDIFKEYLRVFIQIGYILLFSPAFPIASLVCYVSFLFEIRTDAYKLLTSCQRPAYRGAQDIGSWQKVLEALMIAAVVTNVGLIGCTTTYFTASLPWIIGGYTVLTPEYKLTALLLMALLVLAARYVVDALIPDVPVSLALLRAKRQWGRKASAAVAAAGGGEEAKGLLVHADGRVGRRFVSWDDAAIPERFFVGLAGEVARPAPMAVEEWTALRKAGEALDEAKRAKALDA